MTHSWFAFRAYNTQTEYGFGSENEAERYCDHLNAARENNVYAAHELSADEAAEFDLDNRDDGFNLDDALAEIAGIR